METPAALSVHLPVTLSYSALEAAMRKKILDTPLPPANGNGEEPYALVRELQLSASPVAGYQLQLMLTLDILRTVFKREGVALLVLASLGYDNQRQLLFVRSYKVDARTQSRFYNGSLEVLANSVGYDQILKRARIDIGALIGGELSKVNEKLAGGFPIKGVVLAGAVDTLAVDSLTAGPDGVDLQLRLMGQVQVAVHDLLGLMPPETDTPL